MKNAMRTECADGIARITPDRPEAHDAFDDAHARMVEVRGAGREGVAAFPGKRKPAWPT